MNLLLAAALLLQDKTAEETFKRIEETIEKLKTLAGIPTIQCVRGEFAGGHLRRDTFFRLPPGI